MSLIRVYRISRKFSGRLLRVLYTDGKLLAKLTRYIFLSTNSRVTFDKFSVGFVKDSRTHNYGLESLKYLDRWSRNRLAAGVLETPSNCPKTCLAVTAFRTKVKFFRTMLKQILANARSKHFSDGFSRSRMQMPNWHVDETLPSKLASARSQYCPYCPILILSIPHRVTKLASVVFLWQTLLSTC